MTDLPRLERELALRRRVEQRREEVGDQLGGWGVYARRRNARLMAALQAKLANDRGEES